MKEPHITERTITQNHMHEDSTSRTPVDPDEKVRDSWHTYLSGAPTLLVTILFHLILAAIATYFIVQRVETRSNTNSDEAGAQTPGAAVAEMQHQLEVARIKNSMTTPDIDERVSTTILSQVTMPEIALPSDTAPSSDKLGLIQVQGQGDNVGPGTGTNLQSTGIQMDNSAADAAAFGLANANGAGLAGHFYDLKQTYSKTPTHIESDGNQFFTLIDRFVKMNWPAGFFNNYYTSQQTLYLSQIFVPYMDAKEATKDFGVDNDAKPGYFVVLYKGQFVVPKTGIYRFFAFADSTLHIRVNSKNVFNVINRVEADGHDVSVHFEGKKVVTSDNYTGEYCYPIRNGLKLHFKPSEWMTLEEGQANDIQILLGTNNRTTACWILVEEKGGVYDKTPEGYPILPIFKMSTDQMPTATVNCPPYDKRSLGWTLAGEGADTDIVESAPQ